MRKRNVADGVNADNLICVDLPMLAQLLSLGIQKADKLGEDAGAVVRIGKRKLYNVSKIKTFINTLSN